MIFSSPMYGMYRWKWWYMLGLRADITWTKHILLLNPFSLNLQWGLWTLFLRDCRNELLHLYTLIYWTDSFRFLSVNHVECAIMLYRCLASLNVADTELNLINMQLQEQIPATGLKKGERFFKVNPTLRGCGTGVHKKKNKEDWEAFSRLSN